MDYLIFVLMDNDETEMHSGPVDKPEVDYLLRVGPKLKPMSDEEYLTGPAIILNTAARFSYVLDGEDVWWFTEWDPGLIVVRFRPDGTMSWVALRSPVPDFGGREPDPIDEKGYNEYAPNPQYTLVFDPWDAQFSKQYREWGNFRPVDKETEEKWSRAMAHVVKLSEQISERFPDFNEWHQLCLKNLKEWSGEGLRKKNLARPRKKPADSPPVTIRRRVRRRIPPPKAD